jgi:hypothetical protein
MIILYRSKADFLRKVNFLQTCIYLGFDQFYRAAVNIFKKSAINKQISYLYIYCHGEISSRPRDVRCEKKKCSVHCVEDKIQN